MAHICPRANNMEMWGLLKPRIEVDFPALPVFRQLYAALRSHWP
jgi:hypothetical protein